MGEGRGVHRVLVGKPEGKKPFGLLGKPLVLAHIYIRYKYFVLLLRKYATKVCTLKKAERKLTF
jgi:hypothetical protein